MNNETTPAAGTCTCEPLCSANPSKPYPRHGVELRPVFLGDFDRYTDRGWHQVRVNLWGWPAAVIEWIMRSNWRKRRIEPDGPNNRHTGHSAAPAEGYADAAGSGARSVSDAAKDLNHAVQEQRR